MVHCVHYLPLCWPEALSRIIPSWYTGPYSSSISFNSSSSMVRGIWPTNIFTESGSGMDIVEPGTYSLKLLQRKNLQSNHRKRKKVHANSELWRQLWWWNEDVAEFNDEKRCYRVWHETRAVSDTNKQKEMGKKFKEMWRIITWKHVTTSRPKFGEIWGFPVVRVV